jgi:hypothetical protein
MLPALLLLAPFWRRPFANPARAALEDFVSGMLGKFDAQLAGMQSERHDASIGQRTCQISPLLSRATAPDVALEDGRGFRFAAATPEKGSLGQLTKGHKDAVRRGLHDAGVAIAKTLRKAQSDLGRIRKRDVELEIWHCGPLLTGN